MGCIYVNDNDADWGFTNDRKVKARKEHVCSECARTISIAERYEYTFGAWDGIPGVYKTCSDCLSARAAFFGAQWIYGEIWEFIFETISEDDIPLGSLEDLTPSARKKVIDFIDR